MCVWLRYGGADDDDESCRFRSIDQSAQLFCSRNQLACRWPSHSEKERPVPINGRLANPYLHTQSPQAGHASPCIQPTQTLQLCGVCLPNKISDNGSRFVTPRGVPRCRPLPPERSGTPCARQRTRRRCHRTMTRTTRGRPFFCLIEPRAVEDEPCKGGMVG